MDSDEKSASIQKGESEKYYVKWWLPHTPGLPLNVQLSKGVVYSLHLSEQEEAAQDLESLGTPLPLHLAMATQASDSFAPSLWDAPHSPINWGPDTDTISGHTSRKTLS